MTPEEEAAEALDNGAYRSTLRPEVRDAYDRLTAAGRKAGEGQPGAAVAPRRTRSSPEARANILEMFKRGNRKYALPFESNRLAVASFSGGNWEEYGQIVLQMAILDTLLSIEDLLTPDRDEQV